MHTLCGKELAGSAITDEDADCQACLRRRADPARLSSAFFNQDEGSRLLELSLQAAQRRRQGRPDLRVVTSREPEAPARRERPSPAASRASARAASDAPAPTATPAPPERRGELHLEGMRRFSDDVYLSPAGVIVRLRGDRIVEVVSESRAQLVRTPAGFRLRAGDLSIEERDGGLEARLDP